MRKFIKNQLIDLVETIKSGIEYAVSKHESPNVAQNMLMDCYEGITSVKQRIGNNVSHDHLENYTKSIENIQEKLELLNDAIFNNSDFDVVYKEINKMMNDIKSMLEQEEVKLEVVFFPYKASMWDSLESIWLAAKEDKNCEAYVVVIPYFDRNPDGSLGEMHYEGTDFPEYVPIVDWKSYSLEKRKPDIGYVHNPYDDHNFVTCVHPDYFSLNLKKYIDTLVYVPYYSVAGFGETAFIPSYLNFDYIIVQTEEMKKTFNKNVPQEKFLVLGSPKFDRIINMSKNLPEPPRNWKERMTGKRVYFYNTPLASLLSNTEVFLKKMKYVFESFAGREDSLLLWRPHPLFESTIKSMRPQYYMAYLQLKKYFLENNIGIIDTTSDIEKSVVLSDVYISASGSSIEALFGIIGKPMFMLNNFIDDMPQTDDWRGEVIKFSMTNPEYMLTLGNRLFEANMKGNKLLYKYVCDTAKYPLEFYYSDVQRIKNKLYLCNGFPQNVGVIENGNFKSILPDVKGQLFKFVKMYNYEKYIVFISFNYPAIVRYNIETEKVDCYTDNLEIFTGNINDGKVIGGSCVRKNILFIASPTENYVLAFDILTGKYQLLTTASKSKCGCLALLDDGEDLWFMPMTGTTITRWNPNTGKVNEYSAYPEGFTCINPIMSIETQERPFFSAVDCKDFILFAPWWANMFIKLDKSTGKMTEWIPPFDISYTPLNGYYSSIFGTSRIFNKNEENEVYIATLNNKKLYKLNLQTNEYVEIKVEFDKEFLTDNAPKFSEQTNDFYVCYENAFNTLKDLLDGKIKGHDKEKQIKGVSSITENADGTAGQKIHEYIEKIHDNV